MGRDVGSVYPLFFCFFTVCLALVWTPVQGKYQLIGSDEPIIAVPGEDVTLPCHLDPEEDVQDWTVEWSIPDPSERQSQEDVVFLYRTRMELHGMMIVSYIGRASLFVDGLKHGDMSLKIRNVTLEDEARYKCLSLTLDGVKIREAFVQLVVDPNLKASTTETSLLPTDLPAPDLEEETMSSGRSRLALWISLGVFIILLVASAFILQRLHQNRNVNWMLLFHTQTSPSRRKLNLTGSEVKKEKETH
ncbi:butyrophilin subfamily 3 member A2-like isoform X2 [Melanotaenia boesemani]|uniref:butyrophilin subfamily 3 member A2-like isoform X2 n=1 Tax=Melanotaenia boesemani TaxID=1250792 RepID=UPI001C043599|nr:butyrophilin subfamily 3 member A2-like isoform X2 [Melanotaenia boesemani]